MVDRVTNFASFSSLHASNESGIRNSSLTNFLNMINEVKTCGFYWQTQDGFAERMKRYLKEQLLAVKSSINKIGNSCVFAFLDVSGSLKYNAGHARAMNESLHYLRFVRNPRIPKFEGSTLPSAIHTDELQSVLQQSHG